jgi:hypothetical protein
MKEEGKMIAAICVLCAISSAPLIVDLVKLYRLHRRVNRRIAEYAAMRRDK